MSLQSLVKAAQEEGLVYRGGFIVAAQDKVKNVSQNQPATALALFGNAGSSIWARFCTSAEYQDGEIDPLNRWSKRIGLGLAKQFAGKALFPFGRPPHQPFLQWAKKTEALSSSKIGLLIHPQYGLWHAYRFAIALPESAISAATDKALLHNEPNKHACDSCASQVCLSSCPVNAFTEGNYDVEACYNYLDDNPLAKCHSSGCQARAACPEGKDYLYDSAHAAFHIQKFLIALQGRFSSA